MGGLRELRAIGITNPWRAFQAMRNFAITVWDPKRSDIKHGINALIQGSLRDADPDRVEQMKREHPEVAQLYAEGYDPELDPRRLEALPDGTLGREYLRFIRANGIDPLGALVEMGPPQNYLQYVFKRSYKLHDVMHVVLGCDASILGEVRIVSFSLGQSANQAGFVGRAPAMALAVLFLHLALRNPVDMKPAVRLAREWMELGERAASHAGFRIEDHLDRPIAEVREMVLRPIAARLAEAPHAA